MWKDCFLSSGKWIFTQSTNTIQSSTNRNSNSLEQKQKFDLHRSQDKWTHQIFNDLMKSQVQIKNENQFGAPTQWTYLSREKRFTSSKTSTQNSYLNRYYQLTHNKNRVENKNLQMLSENLPISQAGKIPRINMKTREESTHSTENTREKSHLKEKSWSVSQFSKRKFNQWDVKYQEKMQN